MNTIETDRLSHRYGRTEAVHDLSLTVPAGSVCLRRPAKTDGRC